MGQLTWQNIDTNFGGGGPRRNSLLDDSFDPLQEALAAIDKKQRAAHASEEIEKMMTITDVDVMREAFRQKAFDITPENYQAFQTRIGDLLTEKKTEQDLQIGELGMKNTEANIRNTDDLIRSRGISDQGQMITNQISQFGLDKSREELDLARERLALAPEAAKQIAAMDSMALSGNVEGAQRLFNSDPVQEMLVKAGLGPEERRGISNNFDDLYRGAVATESTRYTTGRDIAQRPVKAQTEDLNNADALRTAQNTDVTGRFNQEKVLRDDKLNRENVAIQEKALGIFDALRKSPDGGTADTLYEAAIAYDTDPQTKKVLLDTIQAAAGEYANRPFEQVLDSMYINNPNANTGPRMVGEGFEQEAGALVDLIDRHEGGGDYSTLYGNAQKANGRFAGYDVRTKTIGELDEFTKREYGDWVAGKNNGTFASPMGRYQIVNQTLQAAAKHLGLSPDTLFDEKTQDQIFQFLVKQRLGNRGGLEGQLSGMRQEWAGLKNVDDATLANAIQGYTSGTPQIPAMGGLEGAIYGSLQRQGDPRATVPLEESSGRNADLAIKSFIEDEKPLSLQNLITLRDQNSEIEDKSGIVTSSLIASDALKGQMNGLIKALEDPANQGKLLGPVVDELKAEFSDMEADQLTDEVKNAIARGMDPGIAKAFLLAVPEETLWADFTRGSRHINREALDDLYSEFFNTDSKDPGERIRGAVELMKEKRDRAASLTNLEKYQQDYAKAMEEVFNIADRKKTQPNLDETKPLRRLELARNRVERELAVLDQVRKAQDEAAAIAAQPGLLKRMFSWDGYSYHGR